MTIDTVDFDRLGKLYRVNNVVRAVVDWVNDRERDPRNSETKAGNLQGDLANRGERFSIDEVRGALDAIANCGCGTYQPGRPVENSRITWLFSAREIVAVVLEGAEEEGAANQMDYETADEMETHYFPVRPGLSLPVKIRSDMTAAELENMSEFLQIIAKSRGSNGAQ
jgi:hypothetical protein